MQKRRPRGEVNKIPSNHSPFFAPVLHPTLETGVETMVVGALAWLSRDGAAVAAAQTEVPSVPR